MGKKILEGAQGHIRRIAGGHEGEEDLLHLLEAPYPVTDRFQLVDCQLPRLTASIVSLVPKGQEPLDLVQGESDSRALRFIRSAEHGLIRVVAVS